MFPSELEPSAGSFPLGEQKNRSDEQVELVEDILKEQEDEQDANRGINVHVILVAHINKLLG